MGDPATPGKQTIMRRSLLLCVLVLGVFGVLGWFALHFAPSAGRPAAVAAAQHAVVTRSDPRTAAGHERDPLATLLLQVIVIVACAKALGAVFARIGQPSVIGEIVAGILLGPSLFGGMFPGAAAYVFPPPSMSSLSLLSQIGVILFMFAVGIDLDAASLRKVAQSALVVSQASIIVPFSFGVVVALALYRLVPEPASFVPFAMFLGVSMSITAFPVLARIVGERGLAASPVGFTALAAASVGDAIAWCILAVLVPLVGMRGPDTAIATVLGLAAFAALMIFLVRPAAARLAGPPRPEGAVGTGLVAGALIFAFASALCTEAIGVHAFFGAFLAGVVMPSHRGLRALLKGQLEAFSAVMLLPLFFALTGLRMQLALLNDWPSWLACGVIIVVAVVGKMGAATAAARWTGMNWLDSLSVGALMNTRGLVELVVLNVGYDLGVLPAKIFAMLVLMALVTTFMTGPLLSLFDGLRWRRAAVRTAGADVSAWRVNVGAGTRFL
jgi:Kef-type K+ transport system membrane component KefB